MATAAVYANLEQTYAATDAYRRKQVINQVFRKHFFMQWMRAKGRMKIETAPGNAIQINITVGENPNIGFDDPDRQETWGQADTLRTASFPWSTVPGNWHITEKQLTHNMSPAKVVDLVKLQNDAFAGTYAKTVSNAIMAGVGPTDANPNIMNGLANTIWNSSSLRPPSYGGLTVAEYDVWQANVVTPSNGLAGLISDLTTLWIDCTDESEPDVSVATPTAYVLYQDSMAGAIRYRNTEIGDAVFSGLDFMGKPFIFDKELAAITSTPTGWSGTPDTASTNRVYQLTLSDWSWVFTPGHTLSDIANPELVNTAPSGIRGRGALAYLESQLLCEKLYTQGLYRNMPSS